jgi:hypothetical protein
MKELISARDALLKDRLAAFNRQAVALAPSSNVSSSEVAPDPGDRQPPQNSARRRPLPGAAG